MNDRRKEAFKKFSKSRKGYLCDEESFNAGFEAALSPAGTGQPDGAPEELAREICRELYDRFVMGGWEPQDAHAQLAALLRSRMERAERCELCKSGDIPIGHLYHFTDEGRESCKNCRCIECLPSAPDTEKET